MNIIQLVTNREITSTLGTEEAKEVVVIDGFLKENLLEMKVRFETNGFAIFETKEKMDTPVVIDGLAKHLHLGDSYISGYNQMNFKDTFNKENNLTTISQTASKTHPFLNTSNAQGLHSDATFDTMGKVPTTILYCVKSVPEGGDTILFDSVNAFRFLQSVHPEWAEALLHPEAMEKKSELGDNAHLIDAPFKVLENGEIISRFSLDLVTKWERGFELVPNLEKAIGFMSALVPLGSGFSSILRLEDNQGIIFANDKIAHGRTAYVDNPENPRKMVRGLFLERPIV
jgi:hypothetical protein